MTNEELISELQPLAVNYFSDNGKVKVNVKIVREFLLVVEIENTHISIWEIERFFNTIRVSVLDNSSLDYRNAVIDASISGIIQFSILLRPETPPSKTPNHE